MDSIRASIEKSRYDAVIFDLDGVVTQTAAVHAAAWKRLFDAYLAERAARTGTGPGGANGAAGDAPGALRPFDLEADYRLYVDGKPRYDGVRDFLASRGIELPVGDPSDPPERETVCGLGNRKNDFFNAEVREHGVKTFPPRSSSSTSCTTPRSGWASCRRARTPPWCSTPRGRRTFSRCVWTAW